MDFSLCNQCENNIRKDVFMKKFLTLVLSYLLLTSSLTAFAADNNSNIITNANQYTPQQIQKEYYIAVANKDTDRQNELLQMAREQQEILKNSIESQDKLISPKSIYDPTQEAYYEKYFSSASWIYRDGVVSLSMYPISPLKWIAPAPSRAWGSIVYKHSSDYRWKNTSVMKDQFYCHYWLAGSFKVPWNIEPHKTSINPITCN
jgi:hypothetical protein